MSSNKSGVSVVSSSRLMVTAGATQALHMVASILIGKDGVVFTEDPTYFAAHKVLQEDLQMALVPGECRKTSRWRCECRKTSRWRWCLVSRRHVSGQ